MAAPFPGYLNCSSLGLSSWVFGLGRGTAVPLEILGRGTSGCGPRALRRSRAGGGGPVGHQPRRRSHCRTRTRDCCGAVGTTPAPRKSCQMGAVRRVGSRAPLQRCYNVFGGLATAKGATATDLKLCRRSAPHATRRGRSGQPPNSARTCLSTHKKRLARWFVF